MKIKLIAFTILILWTRKFKIKYSFVNFSYYIFLFISYLVTILFMEAIDTKYFWKKYPTIEIEEVRIHNPHA